MRVVVLDPIRMRATRQLARQGEEGCLYTAWSFTSLACINEKQAFWAERMRTAAV
jgi:hypothetical protein